MRILFIFINAILFGTQVQAQSSSDAIVPPIQFPEQKIEDSNVGFDSEKAITNSDKMKEINLEKQMELIISNKNAENEIIKNIKPDDSIGRKKPSISLKKKENEYDFLKEDAPKSRTSADLWKFFTLAISFALILAALGYLLAKMKRKGAFSLSRSDKIMDVVSSLSLSPKRQIIILKIRDQEIVISSTETGINFLTEVSGFNYPNKIVSDKKPNLISDKMSFSKFDKNFLDKNELKKENVNHSPEKVAEKKSDILLKALKSLNSNSLSQKNKHIEDKPSDENKPTNFPKYLANQFESESKKDLKKKDEEVDSVENVTNLIREKLRSMKPLN